MQHEVREISESDHGWIISSISEEMLLEDFKEEISVWGTIGFKTGESWLLGIEVDGQFFLTRRNFTSAKEREALIEHVESKYSICRIELELLAKSSKGIILYLDSRGWTANAVPDCRIEMRFSR